MEKLLSFLQTMPEFAALLEGLNRNEPAAVTGIGQINRRSAAKPAASHCTHLPG